MSDMDVWLNALEYQILHLSKQGLGKNWTPLLARGPNKPPSIRCCRDGADRVLPNGCLPEGAPRGSGRTRRSRAGSVVLSASTASASGF